MLCCQDSGYATNFGAMYARLITDLFTLYSPLDISVFVSSNVLHLMAEY